MDNPVAVYKQQVVIEAEEEYHENNIACSSSSSYKSASSWSKTGQFRFSVDEDLSEFSVSSLGVVNSAFSIESARISSSNWRRHDSKGGNSEGLVSSQKELSEEASRLLYINDSQQTNNRFQFAGNEIRTAKYSIFTFLPRNLFEQFHRVAYIYFLVLASLNQVPQLEVFAKEIAFLPLLFVLFVTAIKDAYEDLRRHRSDKIENNSMADVLVNGKFEQKRWKDIHVGEIIKVCANEALPCDMVLLSTSDATGVAYVQTTNLDGESNLKTRYAKQETLSRMPEKEGISGFIRCENPNRNIYGFQAYMELDGKRFSLGPSNIVLRGCELKNTAWAVGVAVYTGKETKAMLNSSGAPSKRSRLEMQMNREIIVLSFFLIALCSIITTLFGVWIVRHEDGLNIAPFFRKQDFTKNNDDYKYYGKIREILFTFMMSVIMFQIMIPISLYISMEVVRLGQAYFMTRDTKLSDNAMHSKFQCRALNINEDLGQIKYIFSDKTGTLTENKMEFRCASIRGVDYNHSFVGSEEDSHLVQVNGKILKPKVKVKPNEDLLRLLRSGVGTEDRKHAEDFFLALAACNTIVPLTLETSDENVMLIDYQGESPDEQALVYAAAAHGYTLVERTSGHIDIDMQGKKQRFNILGLHEFDSDRKRMSVVVGCPDNAVKLFVKGADSSMFGAIHKSMDLDVVHATEAHLHGYSSLGLRTLVVAVRAFSDSDFKQWQLEYEKASTALIGRVNSLRNLAAKFESNLSLLGASAIEDKLQGGVPEAIESLRRAGIKVWVLTGDKQETAISIGYSCSLLTEDMVQIIINSDSNESCRKRLQEAKVIVSERLVEGMKPTEGRVSNPKQVALIIDGTSLVYILESELEDELFQLATKCDVVLCCRVAPMQKAGIVALIKNRTDDMTLAIGDGANDVSMLQVADVGVGISGQEGRQAVMASDFAIGQFRFLVPLLLVHGHWNYQRMGYMVLYNFYKNAVLVLLLFWYELYTAYTSTSTITGWSLVLYSIIYTTLPTVVISILEKDLSHKTLLKYPQLYGAGQRSECYNAGLFWLLMLETLWQSAVIFYVPYFTYRNSTMDASRMGDLLILALVILVSIHFAMDIMCWTWITHAVLWGSVLATCICVIVIDSIRQLPGYWAIYHFVACPSFWLVLILILVAAGMPHFVLKLIKQQFRPSDVQIAREMEKNLKPYHLSIASLESTVNSNSFRRS
ncbi:phospholipid-transporting ATPase 1-like isoform X2 [Nymphaea colorata]|uniref:phospholipid-transporting ATPase 1-like isoform X2 n=1 Tax=Nymphaea colorata TaxID=210225 RepID=UPI00129E5DCE|nr:phospholipid-transporting ATPase 1-like isoform X2 [Nymphaea colorata]